MRLNRLALAFALALPVAAAAQPAADPAAPPADAPAATPPAPPPPPEPAPAPAASEPAPAPEPAPAAAPPAKPAVEVHGFGSIAFTHNFAAPADHTNLLRVFDVHDNSVTIDAVEVSVLRPVAAKGDLGFRADLVAGSAIPRLSSALGLFKDATGGATDIDLQQAYGSWRATDKVTVDIGKFVTPTGYEVIEGWDGWNDQYSRSILFGYAIPFTHTGARVAVALGDVTATAYLINGWDNAVDENLGKTFALNALYVHGDLTAAATVMSGKEIPGWRTLIDAVAMYKIGTKAVVGVNGDYASADLGATSATWYGAALYASFNPSDRFTIGARGEWFDDKDGARTGTAQTVTEGTLTATVHVAGGAHVRAEVRADHSDQKTLADAADPKQTQVTLALNAVAVF